MDFTIETSNTLITALQKQGFLFQSFADLIENRRERATVLRHDVDKLPENSLLFARWQAEMGIKGTYYFRIVPGSFNEKIINEIHSLGHEVGYHYEDLSFTWAQLKAEGRRQKAEGEEREKGRTAHNTRFTEEELCRLAIESFSENLEKLRKIVPVKTICMHGSPMSRWDSRLLWKYYDYHDFGIIGEPYFDIDFNEVLYLTDTGRRWDGDSFNIRDKAEGRRQKAEGIIEQVPLQPSASAFRPQPLEPSNQQHFQNSTQPST